MFSESTAVSLRRLKVLNNALNVSNNSIKYINKRNFADKVESKNENDSSTSTTYIKIGECMKEIKLPKCPEKVPTGYLQIYGGVLSESQNYLRHLKWLLQKDSLKQDIFLIGAPPGSYRRHLAMHYAEITKREVEYLCLTRDTTESDIKQRREVTSGSVIYTNQCAISAALNGRLLIIEGIEKAERNLLPILNNLLENRELNLDDGKFLVAPDRYDKLVEVAKSNNIDLTKLNLLRVHEDFRIISIGLPVPKYKGNPLDPPLRSRHQSQLVNYPAFQDHLKYLKTLINNNQYLCANAFIDNILSFAYSFYQQDINNLNLSDFPLENLDKLVNIVNICKISDSENSTENILNYISLNSLINKLYPYKLILKDDELNRKLYLEMLKKFNLTSARPNNEEIDYKLINVTNINAEKSIKVEFKSYLGKKKLNFKIDSSNELKNQVQIENNDFIMNNYHSNQLVELLLTYSSSYDICLIGNRGVGKTALITKLSNLLNYDNVRTIQMFKDMTQRDLIQQRITLLNGDTKWNNSVLIEACINGDLCILDGIHRLRDDVLLSLRRLIQDRELDLLDGRKLLRHDKYDLIIQQNQKDQNSLNRLKSSLLRISPSFRIIALAEPPSGVTASINQSGNENRPANASLPSASANNSSTVNTSNWLTSEILNLFLFHTIEPLESKYEYEILSKKFNLNEKHKKLFEIVDNLRQLSAHDLQLKQISKLFSLRQLIRLSRKLEKYPNLELRELIENACLYKFMPQLNKQTLNDFLKSQNLDEISYLNQTQILDLDHFKSNATNNNKENIKSNKTNIDIHELVKIPDTLFFDNKLHTIILNNLLRDFKLGEHLLLIGNQGTGKNKLVDKFLMLLNRPREYIQLHRDTTVHSLTVQVNIKSGIVYYEDSPLVKAVKNGHILVIDEADKASIQVTCILKSLIECGEMTLSDGRMILPSTAAIKNSNEKEHFILTHKDFRIIILANRPGYPFLGNDFFSIIGDLLSCHPIDNPDPVSEIEMLKAYAPNVSEMTLNKLVSAFSALRELSDQGLISYPYSTREIVNIAKHLEKYPNDSLSNVIRNIFDFDYFNEQNDMKSTFKEIMVKHGIPIDATQLVVNLAKTTPIPALLPLSNNLSVNNLSNNADSSLKKIDLQLKWKYMGDLVDTKDDNSKLDRREERINSFNELRCSWYLPINKNNLINDFLVTNDNSSNDIIYVNILKPISILRVDKNKNEIKTFNLEKFFPLAWRTYFPKLKLFSFNIDNSQQIYLFEENLNNLYKIDFGSNRMYELNRLNFVANAQKTMNRFFFNQNQTFKLLRLYRTSILSRKLDSDSDDIDDNYFISYRKTLNQIEFLNLNKRYQINIELNNKGPIKIDNIIQVNNNLLLIQSPSSSSSSSSDKQFNIANDYYLLQFSDKFYNLDKDYTSDFNLSKMNNILESNDDFFLSQINYTYTNVNSRNIDGLKNLDIFKNIIDSNNNNNKHDSRTLPFSILPTIYHHFIITPDLNEINLRRKENTSINTYFCRRDFVIKQNHAQRNYTMPILQTIVNFKTNQVITQLPLYASNTDNIKNQSILGYLEIMCLNDKSIRQLEIPKPALQNKSLIENENSYLNVNNEANYLFQGSTTNENIFTLDFYGCLREWEIS